MVRQLWASFSHLCVTVTKQHNLVPVGHFAAGEREQEGKKLQESEGKGREGKGTEGTEEKNGNKFLVTT